MALPRADKADICLLLEGTFPYVSGGVSSWVNQIIRGFPEYTFACCFIGSRPEDYGDMKYTLPDNVVHLEVHYLHDFQRGAQKKPKKGDPEAYHRLSRLHDLMRSGEHSPEREALLGETLDGLGDGCCYSEESFLHSRASWDFISDAYREYSRDPSFVDYFWTVRIMHAPLWVLNDIASCLLYTSPSPRD